MVTGQGNGQGGREHGQKCDQLPGQRSLTDPAAREHVARVWGISPDELPQPGYSRRRDHERDPRAARSRGCSRSASIPLVSLPDANFTREALEKLEFFGVDRLLSLRDRHACRRRARGQSPGGRGGRHRQRRGARHPYQEGGRSARKCAPRFRDHLRSRAPSRSRTVFSVPRAARDFRRAAAGFAAAASPITTASRTRRSTSRWACSGPVRRSTIPGTPRLFEGGRFFHPDGKARFMKPRMARQRRPGRRRVPHLPHDGPRREPVPLGHADAAHRRTGGSVSRAQAGDCIREWRSSTASRPAIG